VPDPGAEEPQSDEQPSEASGEGFSPLDVLGMVVDELSSLATSSCHKISQELKNAEAIGTMTVRVGGAAVKKQVFEFLGLTKAQPAPSSTPSSTTSTVKERSDPEAAAVIDAVIPGYDDLSASQVIRLLDELEPDGLDAVDVHESGHRGRRTILNKVHQLQLASDDG
jgi:hypothetical protein